jgi:hypothetical protein
MGIRLAAAAVALNTGQSGSNVGLDDSSEALARCAGEPEAVIFFDAFPRGKPVCVNCHDTLGTGFYSDANKICIAQCEDTFGTVVDGNLVPDNPPTAANREFCESKARVSTNAPVASCFDDICSSAGTPNGNFPDPRRLPEAVVWTDISTGVTATGNDLTKTGTSNPPAPDVGAASAQRFTKGDGYVEFSAAETNRTHVLGLSADPAGCPVPCSDTDGSVNDIAFGIVLNSDGRVYIGENGAQVIGPGAGGSFRNNYAVGERFRLNLTQNSDGTAKITYSRLMGPCVPGSPCPEEVMFTSVAPALRYPFRVDASFREPNATVNDVRIVRIQ